MSPSRLLLRAAAICFAAVPVLAEPTIETVAGNGLGGFNGDGRHALATSFHFPANLHFDDEGGLYVADLFNHRVRRIDATTRIVSTVAGNGVRTGIIDGPGGDPADDLGDGRLATEASLHNAAAVSWALDGAVFVGDRENRRLRMVDPFTGIISTLAGTGIVGQPLSGVPGTQSDLYPTDLDVDAQDNPLVMDSYGSRVAKVDRASGFIFKVSGVGTGPVFPLAYGFASDSVGRYYFADGLNHEIRRVTPSTGASVRIAGITGQPGYSGDGGPAVNARLGAPQAVALAADRYLFVADQGNHRVRMVDLVTGIIVTVAGNGTRTHSIDGPGGSPADDLGDGGPASQATFNGPGAVEIGPDSSLYVGDAVNRRVRRVSGFCLPGLSAPPVLTVTPTVLWPPNHGMVEIVAAVTGCAGPVPATLVSVASSEADDAPGGADGHTTGDVQGADTGTEDLIFHVRAERSASEQGRTYTATYEADDDSGSSVLLNATILVPRDLHSIKPLAEVAARETPPGTLLEWAPIPDALSYSVVRGRLSAIRQTGSSLDLGRLDCVTAATTRTDLQGFEDGLAPDPGEGFFYLVGYRDAWTDSDGTERVTVHPVRYSGGCT